MLILQYEEYTVGMTSGSSSSSESVVETINELAAAADPPAVFPDAYTYSEVESLVLTVIDSIRGEIADMYSRTVLSKQEAAVLQLREVGLTHTGIAVVLTLTTENFTAYETDTVFPRTFSTDKAVSPRAVSDHLTSAREKYVSASHTHETLRDVVYTATNWECPGCEEVFDLQSFVAPPTECPSCKSPFFLGDGSPK